MERFGAADRDGPAARRQASISRTASTASPRHDTGPARPGDPIAAPVAIARPRTRSQTKRNRVSSGDDGAGGAAKLRARPASARKEKGATAPKRAAPLRKDPKRRRDTLSGDTEQPEKRRPRPERRRGMDEEEEASRSQDVVLGTGNAVAQRSGRKRCDGAAGSPPPWCCSLTPRAICRGIRRDEEASIASSVKAKRRALGPGTPVVPSSSARKVSRAMSQPRQLMVRLNPRFRCCVHDRARRNTHSRAA